jgi:hypothetical protein
MEMWGQSLRDRLNELMGTIPGPAPSPPAFALQVALVNFSKLASRALETS